MSPYLSRATVHYRIFAQASIALLLTVPLSAHAEWKQEFTPYLWMVNIKTTAGGSGHRTTSELNFANDLLPILDAGWMHMYEARQDNWSIMNDVLYMKVSDRVSKSKSLGSLTANANANISFQENAGGLDGRLYARQ